MKKISIYADTLSEVFTEWLLYDGAHKTGLKEFIDKNYLNSLLNKENLRDIVEEKAYLKNNAIPLIVEALPFEISIPELKEINDYVRIRNRNAQVIELDTNALIEHKNNLTKKAKNIKRNYDQEYYIKNSDRIKKRSDAWRRNNLDKAAEYSRNHRKQNLEEYLFREFLRRFNNRDAINECSRKKYHDNIDDMRLYGRNRYKRDKDRMLGRSNKYHAKKRLKRTGPEIAEILNNILQYKTEYGEKIERRSQEEIDKIKTARVKEKQAKITKTYIENNPKKIKESNKKQHAKRRLKTTGPIISSFLGDIITHKEQYGEKVNLKPESELSPEYLEKRKKAEAYKQRWIREKQKSETLNQFYKNEKIR